MHTHQPAWLRIAACGCLLIAGGVRATENVAPTVDSPPSGSIEPAAAGVPLLVVSDLGRAVAVDRLSTMRGGDGGTVDNRIDVDGSVDGNTAQHIASGSNSIADGAFSNASGISTVIQNTGSNVLIQNAMIVTVDFGAVPQ